MDNKFDKFLKLYDYSLPSELIAKKPADPRDSAKLLVYKRKTKEVFFDKFANLGKYLPSRAVLVLNDTKVLPARLVVKKQSGGLARILYIGAPSFAKATAGKEGGLLEFLSDRDLNIGSKITVNSKIFFIVKEKVDGHYFLKPSFSVNKTFEVLERYGFTPIPPYIKNSPLSEKQLRKEYQTIFAAKKGSVAAPTASLHFTKRLLDKIRKSGRQIVFVTLHVNLGTFAPLSEENLKKSKLHTEYYEISKKSAEILNKAKKSGHSIIAVGTTAVRALESSVYNSLGSNIRTKRKFASGGVELDLKKMKGETSVFIKEGYKFKFVDGLITNFHVPRSSLLMLVSAFAGRKNIMDTYKRAINKKFRFFSFGDGMMIINE